jgi:hypothetical protein
MSKFLLNLLLQISKALVYSKIKFYLENNFSVTLGTASVFGPAAAHLHFLSPTGHFFSFPARPRPLGRPVGPVGHAPVAPCPLAASLMGRRLQPCRHRLPTLLAPPSSTPRDAAPSRYSSRRRSLPPVCCLFATARAQVSTSLVPPRPARPPPSPVSSSACAPVRHRRSLCPHHPGPPWTRVHRRSTTHGPIPRIIQFQNKSRNRLFWEFCKEAPQFLQN